MDLNRTRLLTVTPLILSVVATSVTAQESTSAASLLLINAKTASSSTAQKEGTVIPLKVSIANSGTYVLTAPAGSGILLRMAGETILDTTANVSSTSDAPKVFITLAAGDHILEAVGEELTLEKIAVIQANLIGMPTASIIELTSALSETEAATLTSQTFTNALSNSSAARVQDIALSTTSVSETTSTTSTQTEVVTSSASVVGSVVSTPRSGDMDRPEVDGIVRNTIRDALTAVLEGKSSSSDGGGGGGGTAPEVEAGDAQSSPLSPPSGVAITQAVQITGGATSDGFVASTGQTLFGGVMDPTTFDQVAITIAPSDRTTTVDVGPTTGQFAIRLFPEDLTTGEATVTLTGISSSDDTVMTVPVSYVFQSGPIVDGVSQALSRVTYGPSADLYSRVRTIGFANYVNEQLNPGGLRDAAFNAMDFDDLIDDLPNNFNTVANATINHSMAHAAFSDKQLQEVMGEFWSNHFHASTKNTNVYEQNVIDREYYRNNAFGNFENLLLYSARSPLMSQFLDNDQSRVGNINENYGREILELHTVGVDGGYGDDDVIAVSRVFTGWNFVRTNPNEEGVIHEHAFDFIQTRHDAEDKVIPFLNTTITGRSGAAGLDEGEELIAMLSMDARTQNYVCGKIVQRFVADVPPANFVDICVTAWAASNGDAGDILEAILLAPEFISDPSVQSNKAKTPYEYSIATIRALDAQPDSNDDGGFFTRFRNASEDAGYDPLRFGLPTGLAEDSASWVNSAVMIASYNDLTDVVERFSEYNIDLQSQIEDAGIETAEEVATYLLTIANADRYTLEEYEAIVGVLKGTDGIFEPLTQNEDDAFERAAGLLVVLPSFHLQ